LGQITFSFSFEHITDFAFSAGFLQLELAEMIYKPFIQTLVVLAAALHIGLQGKRIFWKTLPDKNIME